MKHFHIAALSLAFVLMLGLFAACGKGGSGDQSTSDAQSSASTSAPNANVSQPDVSIPDASAPEQGDISTPDAEVPVALTLSKQDFSLFKAGATYKLAVSGTPEGAELVWTSGDEAVATVAQDGTVTAVTPGVTTITVSAGELTASCTVRCKIEVDEPVSGGADASTPDQSQPEETPQAPAKVDLAAFFETIFTDPANAPALVPMETDALDAFYAGLTAIQTNQRVAYMPMMTAVPCEIVMVECANAADVEAVKTIFKTRIDAMVNDHMNYPMVIEAWETEAKVVSNGNFVALFVVSGMTDEVASNFNALF